MLLIKKLLAWQVELLIGVEKRLISKLLVDGII
jgi:hypothetical protein